MKTLQQAAQALCDRWDTALWKDVAPTAVFIGELRAALAREEAQTVEPAFYVPPERNEYHSRDFVSASRTEKAGWVPLFTRPAPATETVKLPENCGTGHCSCIECVKPAKPPAGEREALITHLRNHSSKLGNEAADMLAADALEIEQTCNCRFVGEINTVQCTLHNAWAETLNEQSGYRKELAALKAQQGVVPQGWKLAPIDPTKEMIEAGQLCPCYQESGDVNTDAPEDYRRVYKAMISAAPQPPQGEKS